MSKFLVRTLLAGFSLALTLAMIAASAPASTATIGAIHGTTYPIADLKLASIAGQKNAAVARADADAGVSS